MAKGLHPVSGPNIFKIQSRSLPEYVFEYHPGVRKVYVVPVGQTVFKDGTPCHEAQLIAENIDHADLAKEIVKAWLSGYKFGFETPTRLVIK